MPGAFPLVSVIMPCWNAAAYLKQSIRSVQEQSLPGWELIIADDASTDDSVPIIQEFLAQDERLRLIQSPRNRGPQAMRNLATAAAQGRYIAFLDSDDWLPSHSLEYRVEYMRRQAAILVCTASERVDAKGQRIDIFRPRRRLFYRDLLATNDIVCSAAMYDSRMLGKIYNFHLYGVDDYVMWLQVLRQGVMAHGLQDVLAVHRRSKESRSWNKWRPMRGQWQTYRRVEQLNWLLSVYYFARYAVKGLCKNWMPMLHMLRYRTS